METWTVPLLIAALLTCYTLYGAIYRLYLSPVAAIPGPKLAILSFWYEFYYDVVRQGRYTFKIRELHKQYGPIIRINPFEVHIDDPDFYDEVYVLGNKRKTEQWSWTVPMFGTPDSILATVDHDIHRRRRHAYSSFFSKQSIRRYGDVIQANVDHLCAIFREYQIRGDKINLMHAWSALAGDVVTEYSFPKSYGLLDQPDFAPDYFNLWISILSGGHVLKQFPWLFDLMSAFPTWFVDKYLPDMAVMYKWQREWKKQIREIKLVEQEKPSGKPSIFETLLDSDLPPQDKSVVRLVDDAQTLVGAGSITTSTSLALATYYILSDEQVLETLMGELTKAMPDTDTPLPLIDLERLSYLSAVILETLRITYGVSHRLQRVSPYDSYKYHDYDLPGGTPVSMTAVLIHDNPSIFPSPRAFQPERWLPLETKGAALQKYLVSFSRGSRQCLGQHLGTAELYIGLACVFRRFGWKMVVVETERERDVEMSHDHFTPMVRKDSKGIFVVIQRE